MIKYPNHLLKLIEGLKKFPGVGSKSAERFAFQLLNWKKETLDQLASLIQEIPEKLKRCEECGCLKETNCPFCTSERKETALLCLIASPKDAYVMESTREYRGLYHVLGGLLSPLDDFGPKNLSIDVLKGRINQYGIKEIVIALDSTLEGDATALYLKEELKNFPLSISRLALGLPMGISLDYIDEGTLARAFIGRSSF